LLDFWEVWCGPCLSAMPGIQKLSDKYKSRGLRVIAITCDSAQMAPAKEYFKKRKYSFSGASGEAAVSEKFGVGAIPHYVLINRKGEIVFSGNFTEGEIEEAIKSVL